MIKTFRLCSSYMVLQLHHDGDEQRMMLMGLKRFTKYTNYPNVAGLRNSIAAKVNKENTYCF